MTDDAARDDTGSSDGVDDESPSGRREVEVPLRLYKTVTVFSTLIAIVAVVVGFLLLDAATIGTGLLRRAVISLLSVLSLTPPESVLSALFAVAGLLCIAGGAVVYVMGTRFKAPEMGDGDGVD
ncbi:MAG: hypothetical protein V5A38_09115 [Halolamina sp.]|uniref:DUF7315 family membrane protein n=1 Tax=Halolamina sp. TaxID=1940283 RepID=UPI002FC3AF4B